MQSFVISDGDDGAVMSCRTPDAEFFDFKRQAVAMKMTAAVAVRNADRVDLNYSLERLARPSHAKP